MKKNLRHIDGVRELVVHDRMMMFWSFVAERQSIYWKRQAGEPRPWTKDPILDKHFFCNVYREQDRGTQFAINYVMKRAKHDTDLVFRVMLYRMFNEPETFKLIEQFIGVTGVKTVSFDGRKAAALLDKVHKQGQRVFRSAWMTSGANLDGESKARAYCMEMRGFASRAKGLTDHLRGYDSMEYCWGHLQTVKWFGSFSAYQVVLDLSYSWKHHWKDYHEWVYPGPGAKLGLLWILGHDPIKRSGAGVKKIITTEECEKFIHHLCDDQGRYFNEVGVVFEYPEYGLLDIHNIEYSLCEFNKYMRASCGGKKKKFVPYEERGRWLSKKLDFTLKLAK